jgi:hypothetical protein
MFDERIPEGKGRWEWKGAELNVSGTQSGKNQSNPMTMTLIYS